jgi:glycosyltransferase involved in cell wall biosynthesis
MPRFSVIVPVYNRAATVLPTLQSVRDQTFTDFECIVVDDGSKDGEELRAVVEGLDDPRFRYVRRENGGESAARNTGVDKAHGEFIAFLDSDDRWLPEKLHRDEGASAQRRVVFSPMLIERKGRIVGQRPKSAPAAGEPIGEYAACRQGFVSASSVCVPIELARQVRWNERIVFGNDTDFAVRLGAIGAEFVMISEPLSIMNDDESPNRMSRSKDWRRVLAWLDDIRPAMTERAYLAYRGWHVARMAAQDGHYIEALGYYGTALVTGALSPSLAVKALGQVFLPRPIYKRILGLTSAGHHIRDSAGQMLR